MFIHLLATLVLGAVAAGLVYIIARPFGWKPPGVVYPMAAALGILAYTVYDEYSWYSRVSSTLPTRLNVVRTYATSMPYQPWTYAVPRVYRFDAVDLGSSRTNPNAPELTMVEMQRVTRNVSSEKISSIIDCKNQRYAEIDRETEFAETGLPTNAKWLNLADHTVLRKAICDGVAKAN